MGLQKATKDRIFLYIMECISGGRTAFAKSVADNFGISLTSVYRYIKELEEKKYIENVDGIQNKYKLADTLTRKSYKNVSKLKEDVIYREFFRDHFISLPYNIQKIWEYSITEMINNAIDHSKASVLHCRVKRNYLYTQVSLSDDGIGAFENIRAYFDYDSVDDAVTELFKGKLTTDPERHSGEGIFFTSKTMDSFLLWANGKIFRHNNYSDEAFDVSEFDSLRKYSKHKGTVLSMRMSNTSQKNLKEVFDKYSSVDGGFQLTSIPISNLYENGYPVSRSQAKRLYHRLNEFKEVILDFNGVEIIGQAFAHELFVVFKNNHPHTALTIINANGDVKKMISHVMA